MVLPFALFLPGSILVALASCSAVFHLDFQADRRHNGNGVSENLRRLRRRDTVEMTSYGVGKNVYMANVSFGTPPQTVSLLLDLADGDTWVIPPSAPYCQTSSRNLCIENGFYDANSSSTYTYLNSNFTNSYPDGQQYNGDYVTDTVTVGQRAMNGLQFAVVYNGSLPSDIADGLASFSGVLGLGYSSQEQQALLRGRPYPNIPEAMADLGIINANAYSLWLNDVRAPSGSVLFGGIDTEKFSGELRTISITENKTQNAMYNVPVTSIRFRNASLISESFAALLDPGTTFTFLPSSVTDRLMPIIGGKYNSTDDLWNVDCALANDRSTMNFGLSWPAVNVTMSQLVFQNEFFARGFPGCYFGIRNVTDLFTLGDTFLRNAYVVFNFRNDEVSIAQAKFNVTTSAIKDINIGINGVPGAVRAPSATGQSPPAISSPAATSTSRRSTAIGVGVTGGLVVLAIIIGTLFCFRKQRKPPDSESKPDDPENEPEPRTENNPEYAKAELPAEEREPPLELPDSAVVELADNRVHEAHAEEHLKSDKEVQSKEEAFVAELPGDSPLTRGDSSTVPGDSATVLPGDSLPVRGDSPTVPEDPPTVSEDSPTESEVSPIEPEDSVTVPEDLVAVFEDSATVPEDSATVSDDLPAVHEDLATVSEDSATVSEDSAKVLEDSATAPEHSPTPENSPTVPEHSATAPEHSATAPEDSPIVTNPGKEMS